MIAAPSATSFLCPPLRCAAPLVALLLAVLPARAAERGEGWVTVPASFLTSRLVRPAGAPAPDYRVVVDVSPARSPRAARPRVSQSCGNEAVDDIAYDYVTTTLRSNPSMAEQNHTHELRFPLRLTPAVISFDHLKIPAEYERTPVEGLSTPRPPYPGYALSARTSGTCRVRTAFPEKGGSPQEVALVESSGDRRIDAHSVQWILLMWRAAPRIPARVHETTLMYQIRYR